MTDLVWCQASLSTPSCGCISLPLADSWDTPRFSKMNMSGKADTGEPVPLFSRSRVISPMMFGLCSSYQTLSFVNLVWVLLGEVVCGQRWESGGEGVGEREIMQAIQVIVHGSRLKNGMHGIWPFPCASKQSPVFLFHL